MPETEKGKRMSMIRRHIWIVFLALAAGMIMGCKKDDIAGPDTSAVLPSDDAADAFASAISGSQAGGGLTAQLEESTSMAGVNLVSKMDMFGNAQWDTTVVRSHTGLWNYNYGFHFNINLVGGSRLDFSYTMKGTYDGPRVSSSDSAVASFQVSNLFSGSVYAATGTYSRYGTTVSKLRTKNSWTGVISVSTTNLSVDKATMKISAGTATMAMSGKTGTGESYATSGKITFMGNDQAILVIGSHTYTINLATGEATLAG
jgi:hypothetical protein